MKFPMLNITNTKWQDGEEDDVTTYILFDDYIYTDDEEIFKKYYKNKLFCDSEGQLFEVIDKRPPPELWRQLLKFLPNVYKVNLKLRQTGKVMTLEELRKFMLDRLKGLTQPSLLING